MHLFRRHRTMSAPACWGYNTRHCHVRHRHLACSSLAGIQPLHAIPPGWPGPAHWLWGWAPMRYCQAQLRARAARQVLTPNMASYVMETWRQCHKVYKGTCQLWIQPPPPMKLLVKSAFVKSIDLYVKNVASSEQTTIVKSRCAAV